MVSDYWCSCLCRQIKAAETARLADLAEKERSKADRFRVSEIELEVGAAVCLQYISPANLEDGDRVLSS